MATKAKTVLGSISTICGPALKIALYIYIQTVCTLTAQRAAYSHTRQWEPSGSISELKHLEICEYRHHTSSPALYSFYLGQLQKENQLYLHPFLWKKECEIVCHQTNISFCVAVSAKLHAQSGCNWLCYGDELMNYALMGDWTGCVYVCVCGWGGGLMSRIVFSKDVRKNWSLQETVSTCKIYSELQDLHVKKHWQCPSNIIIYGSNNNFLKSVFQGFSSSSLFWLAQI